MRKNRLLMSLMFALSYGAVACGGADDNSVDDSTASLKRLADGGFADRSADSDESTEEAAKGDAGEHRQRGFGHLDGHLAGDGGVHIAHQHGDGGSCLGGHIRAAQDALRGRDGGGGKEHDRGGKQDEHDDRQPDTDDDHQGGHGEHHDAGLGHGFGVDGGFPHR